MSKLKHTVSNLSKNKLVKAKVLEVLGDKIAVQLVSNGTKLFGLPYTGGPTSTGKTVYVDYSSGAPIVQVRGEKTLYTAPAQKGGTYVRTEFPQAQVGGPGGTGLIPEHLHEIRGSVIFTVEGLLTQGENPLHIYNDSGETRTFTKVLLVVEAGPVGTSIIVDIHKNGTTIFTTQANRPSIPVGQTGGYSVLIDDTVWDNGDYLTMHVDQVGSDQPGTYLTVQVVYSTNTLDVYGLQGMTLDGLTDVATTNPQDGDSLVYESDIGQWVNNPTSGGAHAYSHEDGGADEIDVTGLSGVLANRQDANKLQGRDIYDHTPEDGEVLKWILANNRWEPGTGGGGGGDLNDLADVVIATPADNEVLAFDNASGDWINQTPAEAGLSDSAHTHAAPDASVVTYTPGTLADWNGDADPGNVDDALDQAAARIDDLELFAPVSYVASSASLIHGTQAAGTYASTQVHDGSYHQITELNGANPLEITYTFTSVLRLSSIVLYGRYQGGAVHVVKVQIYNKDTTNYDEIGEIHYSTSDSWMIYPIPDPVHYINSGTVIVKIIHLDTGVATHNLYIDYLSAQYGSYGGGGITDASGLTYHAATLTDWNGDVDPGNTDDALDQLASRLDDVEAGGTGVDTFLELTDTPDSYSGQALKLVAVNADADALEFIPASAASGGNGIWSVKETSDSAVDPDPVTDTLIPGMTLDFYMGDAGDVAINFFGRVVTGHQERVKLYLDDTEILPEGTYGIHTIGETSGGTSYVTIAASLAVTAGSHTLEARWQASGSTAAITWKYRSLSVHAGVAGSLIQNVATVTWAESPASYGQDQNRTTGGSYNVLSAPIDILVPFKLTNVYWDIYVTGSYTLEILAADNTTVLSTKVNSVTGPSADEDFVLPATLYLFPGRYYFKLTKSSTAAQFYDRNSATYSGTVWEEDGCFYDGASSNFTLPMKLVGDVGTWNYTEGVAANIQGTRLIRDTVSATAADAHTSNSTWEDINSMSLSLTTEDTSDILGLFAFRGRPASNNWEHIAIRFVLGSTNGDSIVIYQYDAGADQSQYHSWASHYLFQDVPAGTYTLKVQWYDNGSSLDYTFYDRRLTGIAMQNAVGPANLSLDNLGLPSDNTNLNASTSRHGLLPKLGGGTTNFLRADGTWAAPAGTSEQSLDDLTDVIATASKGASDLTTGLGSGMSASTTYGGMPASNLVDDSNTSDWASSANNVPEWIKIDLGTSRRIYSYKLRSSNDAQYDLTNFTFQGSTNNTDWVDLDSRTGQTWGSGEWKEFTLADNTGMYRYYRLYITQVVNWPQFSEWELYEAITAANGDVLTYQSSDSQWHPVAPTSHKAQAIFTIEGSLSTVAGALRIYNQMGSTKTISEVFLSAGTAPTGAAIIVDIHKGGTTIFTSQGNRPQIAAGANTGGTTTIDVSSWADGDYLTMDIDQVGSSVPGSNLTVHIVYM